MRSRPLQLGLPRGILASGPFPYLGLTGRTLDAVPTPPPGNSPPQGTLPDAPARRSACRAGSGNTACPPDPHEAAVLLVCVSC